MRYRSLIRMLCCPIRFPFKGSRRFPGGVRSSRNSDAKCSIPSFRRATDSILTKRAPRSLWNNRSVSGQRNDRITPSEYYSLRKAYKSFMAPHPSYATRKRVAPTFPHPCYAIAQDDKETTMSTSSRRTFIAASAAFSLGRVLGANDKINIGIVGIGGRGNDHIKNYAALPNARIVALCDVNQAALETGQAAAAKLTGEQPKGYDDMRKLFADKNVDAVSITTPNHWHALSD